LTISPLNAGNTEVLILVTAENGNVVTYKVTVIKEADPASTITSVEYGHTITNGNIRTVKLGTTGIEMKDQLDNENEYLEIWTADETEQVSDSDPLATGMIVKLMVDGVERHLRPNGKLSASVVNEHKYIWSSYGENMGRYHKDANEIFNGWKNSKRHNELMLSTKYEKMGLGIASDSEGYLYWILIYIK